MQGHLSWHVNPTPILPLLYDSLYAGVSNQYSLEAIIVDGDIKILLALLNIPAKAFQD
jgi:hypothetical protein